MKFIKLYTKEGGYIRVDASEWADIVNVIYNEQKIPWISLKLAACDSCVCGFVLRRFNLFFLSQKKYIALQ